MLCPKCQSSLMYVTRIYTQNEDSIQVYRCATCGEYIDPVILANRKRQVKAVLS